MSAKHEAPAPRLPSNKKLLTAIVTGALSIGAALGYVVPPAVGSGSVAAGEAKLRESIEDLKVATGKSEAKLDMLVQMVRDHVGGK